MCSRPPPPPSTLFFFNDTATTEIYTLSLHDALPIFPARQKYAIAPGDLVVRVLVQNSQQPRVRTPPDEALRVRRGDGDAGLLATAARHGRHVLLERPAGPPPLRGVVLHLPDDLLPRADVGRPGEHAHPVDLRRNRAGLHPLQLGEERAEELELTGIAHLAVWPHRFEFGEQ